MQTPSLRPPPPPGVSPSLRGRDAAEADKREGSSWNHVGKQLGFQKGHTFTSSAPVQTASPSNPAFLVVLTRQECFLFISIQRTFRSGSRRETADEHRPSSGHQTPFPAATAAVPCGALAAPTPLREVGRCLHGCAGRVGLGSTHLTPVGAVPPPPASGQESDTQTEGDPAGAWLRGRVGDGPPGLGCGCAHQCPRGRPRPVPADAPR